MSLKKYGIYSVYQLASIFRLTRFIVDKAEGMNIVTFHRVCESADDDLTITKEKFTKMVRMFASKYQIVPLSEIISDAKNSNKINNKKMAITFDDGYLDNYEIAAPILKQFGASACFFVTSGYIESNRVFPWDEKRGKKSPMMNWRQVRSLEEEGFEIGGHTIDHVNLGTVDIETAKKQIFGCKSEIEEKIGKDIELFAHPFGGKNNIREDTRDIVKDAGFQCCCSCFGEKVYSQSDVFRINRIPVYPNSIEMAMELDNFMTYHDGTMRFNVPLLRNLL